MQFRSNAAVRDSELVIAFDLDGLAALLRAVDAALATGQGHLTPEPCVSPDAFRSVTVTFTGPGHNDGAGSTATMPG